MLIELTKLQEMIKRKHHINIEFRLDMRPKHCSLWITAHGEQRAASVELPLEGLAIDFAEDTVLGHCAFLAKDVTDGN